MRSLWRCVGRARVRAGGVLPTRHPPPPSPGLPVSPPSFPRDALAHTTAPPPQPRPPPRPWWQATAIQREIVEVEGELSSLRLRLEKVASESVAARAIEDQMKLKRERLVELRSRQSGDMEPPSLTRDQVCVCSRASAAAGELCLRRVRASCPRVCAVHGVTCVCPCWRVPCTPCQLETIFDFYANFGRSAVMTPQKSMDSFMFMKFCRECPDLVEGCVPLPCRCRATTGPAPACVHTRVLAPCHVQVPRGCRVCPPRR